MTKTKDPIAEQREKERKERRQEIEKLLKGSDEEILEWLRLQHDSVLVDISNGSWTNWQGNKKFDRAITFKKKIRDMAKGVYDRRTIAADTIRLTLARCYQRNNVCSFESWAVIPCKTPDGTIGFLNVARGTAWDSTVECPEEAADLGLTGTVYAAANGIEGTVSFDGKVVQKNGTAVVDGKVIPPKMPPDWQQIALPTWRGYKGDGRCRVPEELYVNDPIKPVLKAYGLMTCYGEPGRPTKYLERGDEEKFPWLGDIFKIDPSWWEISAEEQDRLHQLVYDWVDNAISYLKSQMTVLERQKEPDSFPEQRLSLGINKPQEYQEYTSIADKRGCAAREMTDKILVEINAYYLWHCRKYHSGWNTGAIGGRKLDDLHRVLTLMLYHRLSPVAESISWMIQHDPKRYNHIGPMQEEVKSILSDAAYHMGKALVQGIPDYKEVLREMAKIHLENGPRYL